MKKLDLLDNIDFDESEIILMSSDLLDLSLLNEPYEQYDNEMFDDVLDEEEVSLEHSEFLRRILVNVPSGTAKVAPPIGPTLSQFGVDVREFCSVFNEITTSEFVHEDIELRVVIFLFKDLSLIFFIKSPSLFYLIQLSLLIKREDNYDFSFLQKQRYGVVRNRRFIRSQIPISILTFYKIFVVKYMFDFFILSPRSLLRCMLSTLFGSGVFVYFLNDKK